MAEWSIAIVLKTIGQQCPVGSNPTPSSRTLSPDSSKREMTCACSFLSEFPASFFCELQLKPFVPPFQLTPLGSGHRIERAFPKETQVFALPGHCQCGLINSPEEDENSPESILERERQTQKLRKSGWSDAKTRRWFEEKSDGDESPGLNSDLAKSFLDFGEKFCSLFVVAVWTPENVTDFDYPRVKVRADEFLSFAPKMSEDQLVEISWKSELPDFSSF